MKKNQHTHKYERINIGSRQPYIVYRCVLDCPHYVREVEIVGRSAACWRCGRTFTITEALAIKKRPHCGACTRGEKSGAKEARTETVKGTESVEELLKKLTARL
jgi:hypothetical protein